jgi:glycyl-tRNA synthetase alpha subunit
MYNLYEAEGKTRHGAGLVIPAHDYILRCSHTFNLLDARRRHRRHRAYARMRMEFTSPACATCWFVALFGEHIVPFSYAKAHSGRSAAACAP